MEPPALLLLSLAMLDTSVVGLGRVALMDLLLARPAAPTRARQLKSVIRRKPIPEVSLEPLALLWMSLAMLATAVVGLGRVALMQFLLARSAAPTRERQLKSIFRIKPFPQVLLEPPALL